MLKDGTLYQDLGPNHFDARSKERQKNRLVRRLTELGYTVELAPITHVKRPARPPSPKALSAGYFPPGLALLVRLDGMADGLQFRLLGRALDAPHEVVGPSHQHRVHAVGPRRDLQVNRFT